MSKFDDNLPLACMDGEDVCSKCGNIRKYHPMSIADGLGHTERCEFPECVKPETEEIM